LKAVSPPHPQRLPPAEKPKSPLTKQLPE